MTLLKVRYVVRTLELDRLRVPVLIDNVALKVSEVRESNPLTKVKMRVPLQTFREDL
jgi:hypothetical protein